MRPLLFAALLAACAAPARPAWVRVDVACPGALRHAEGRVVAPARVLVPSSAVWCPDGLPALSLRADGLPVAVAGYAGGDVILETWGSPWR